jgi:hypothetical protein
MLQFPSSSLKVLLYPVLCFPAWPFIHAGSSTAHFCLYLQKKIHPVKTEWIGGLLLFLQGVSC